MGSAQEPATVMDASTFKSDLLEQIPYLRAFGRSLCGHPDRADDLVQETLVKALKARGQFQAGTNMRAWLFTILRNQYYSECRRDVRQRPWDEETMMASLVTAPSQESSMAVVDLYRALQTLPPEQREALVLVGAGGFSYEEVAAICGCAVGTIKSRVSRARRAVDQVLTAGTLPAPDINATTSRALDKILDDAERITPA